MKFTSTAADISALLATTKTQDPPPQIRPDLNPKFRKPLRRRSPRPPTPTLLPSKRDKGGRVDGGRTVTTAVACLSTERPGPATPLLRWQFDGGASSSKLDALEGEVVGAGKVGRGRGAAVSVRKIGAALWRSRSPDVGGGSGGDEQQRDARIDEDRIGFKSRADSGHGVDRFACHHGIVDAKDHLKSPCFENGPINRYPYEVHPSFQCSDYAMEGATKWDLVSAKASYENSGNLDFVGSEEYRDAMLSSLEAELEKAQAHIEELKAERKSSKKKMEHFLRKLSEERAAWRTREHEKVRAFVDDIKVDLNREKKSRQRLEVVNSKLVNDLAEAKLSAKRYLQEYEKERKARELIEEVCDELAKEIGDDKAEVEALKKKCMTIQEEVEEERQMLLMAEVWREERVQMKLVDAKVILDEKYSKMSQIIGKLENFLRSRSVSLDDKEMREVVMLQKAAASIQLQDLKEFTYKPPNPDDKFSVFEEMARVEQDEREMVPCATKSPSSHVPKMHTQSPEVHNPEDDSIDRPFISYNSQKGGWETLSQVYDQGSSCSPDGSSPSVNRMQRYSNVSGSSINWEINPRDGAPIAETREVCSGGERQWKKVPYISRLWKSGHMNGQKFKIVSGGDLNGKLSSDRRISNGDTISPDDRSDKGGFNPLDVDGQWSSPDDSMNARVDQGKKGSIEWPIVVKKGSLKEKLPKARVDSKKIRIRQVLKQKS